MQLRFGKTVKDIIVEDWKVCQTYVSGYPSIYKKFKTKEEAEIYLKSMSEVKVKSYIKKNKKGRAYRLNKKNNNLKGAVKKVSKKNE